MISLNSRPLQERISGYLDYALPIFLFLLAISFYLRTYDSAMIKITELYMLGTILITLWLCNVFESGHWPFNKNQTLLILPFLLILASGVLSFIRSPLPWGSFDFFVRRVVYSGIALITVTEIRSIEDFRRVILWLTAALVLCALYGLIQYIDYNFFPPGAPTLGIDKFVWRGAFGARIFSTFGNPNFFGNYLVIFIPLLLAIYLRTRQFFLLPLILLSLFNIYWTGSKGPAMGLIGGTAVFSFLVLQFFVHSKKIKMVVFSAAFFIILILGGYIYVRVFKQGAIHSFTFRMVTWLSTWEMVHEKPVLGNGIGTFWVLYPAYRRPAIFHIEGKHNTETDHAENEHLEVWMDEGLVGMGLWIWLIVGTSVGIYKVMGQLASHKTRAGPEKGVSQYPEEVYYMLGFLSGFLGMLIHNFTDVSMRFVSSGAPFWFLAGLNTSLILYSPLPAKHVETMLPPEKKNRSQGWDKFRTNGLRILKLVVLFFIAIVAIRILREFDWCQMRDGMANPNEQPHFFITWAVFLVTWGCCVWWFIQIAFGANKFKTLVALGLSLYLLVPFWGFFVGDANHNRAIFFSKQGIWNKSPENDAKVAGFPLEYKQMYSGEGSASLEDKMEESPWLDKLFPDRKWRRSGIGGALEHYDAVNQLRPDFIMAYYFRGNVYNDWGSQMAAKSNEAFQKGDTAQGEIYRKKADELWNKSMAAYDQTKALGPNYVQMHHQVGMIHHKWADYFNNLVPLAERYGKKELAAEYRKNSKDHLLEALKNYQLYQKIDPVFDQNFYRQAQAYIQLGDLDKAEQMYLDYIEGKECKKPYHQIFGGLYIERSSTPTDRYDLASPQHAHDTSKPTHPEAWVMLGDFYQFIKHSPEKAEAAYKRAAELRPQEIDFAKRLAAFYARSGKGQASLFYWKKVYDINPKDPDVQRFLAANPQLRK